MIHQGDALEVLQALPAASVDAVVTDPPYGERVEMANLRIAGVAPLFNQVSE